MRKRRGKYIDYDYESVYDRQITDLSEEIIANLLKEGKIRSIYATKEIRAGDMLEVDVYPEFTRKEKNEIKVIDQIKKEKQKEAQMKLNEKNSQKRCERLINENFDNHDIWGTLTYSKGLEPKDMKEAQKNMINYIKRLNYYRKKNGLSSLRYVYTTECSDKGRWHHHIVMDGDMPMDLVEGKWVLGKRNQIRRLEKDENGLTGMAHYISKQQKKQTGKYKKVWKASRNLKKPHVRKNHYKFKKRDVIQMTSGVISVEEKMAAWYAEDGYHLINFEIKTNDKNGGIYITARLNRPPVKGRKREKEHKKRKDSNQSVRTRKKDKK